MRRGTRTRDPPRASATSYLGDLAPAPTCMRSQNIRRQSRLGVAWPCTLLSTLTHRLLKVPFWRRARLSIGSKTLASLLRSITTRPRSTVSERCAVGRHMKYASRQVYSGRASHPDPREQSTYKVHVEYIRVHVLLCNEEYMHSTSTNTIQYTVLDRRV